MPLDLVSRVPSHVSRRYFLSAAIDLPPASNFGSLGLTITLAAFGAVAVVRHHIVAERLRAARLTGALGPLHSASLGAALTSAVGGHGVAAIPHNQMPAGHNGFAAMFVLCALLHFHLESYLERTACLSSTLARCSRAMLVGIATVGCATFLSHVVVEEMSGIQCGIGKLAAAAAEIVSCACFLVYLATYSRSFHESHIALTVTVPSGVLTASYKAAPAATEESLMPPTAQKAPVWLSTAPPDALRLRRCRSAGEALGGGCSW